MPQIPGSIPPVITASMDHSSDTVFQVDLVTQNRLDTAFSTRPTRNAILLAFIDLVPDGYAPGVLLEDTNRTDVPLISEQGPDFTSGVVTIDEARFTALLSLTSGTSATSRFRCCAILNTGSLQSFIRQGAFDLIAIGPAAECYVRSTTPKSWSGFGSQELLSTNRQPRTTIHFYHNGTPSASLTVWIYIVLNETMRCLLLGRDSWM